MNGEDVERIAAALRDHGFAAPVAAALLSPGLRGALPPNPGRIEQGIELLEWDGRKILAACRDPRGGGGHALDVAFVRIARRLGAPWVALAGVGDAIGGAFEPGDVVFVTDHVSWMGENPLIGPNDDRWGPRFPDMSRAYSPRLRELGEGALRNAGGTARSGVLAGVSEPRAITPAEGRMLSFAGADLVATSIVPATVAAVHVGLEVLGIVAVERVLGSGADASGAGVRESAARAGEAAMEKVGVILRGVLRSVKP